MEREVVAFDMDVARQAAEPGGKPRGEGDDQAGSNQDQPQDDQWPSQSVHGFFSRGW